MLLTCGQSSVPHEAWEMKSLAQQDEPGSALALARIRRSLRGGELHDDTKAE